MKAKLSDKVRKILKSPEQAQELLRAIKELNENKTQSSSRIKIDDKEYYVSEIR